MRTETGLAHKRERARMRATANTQRVSNKMS